MQLKHLRKMIENLPDDLQIKIAVNTEFGGRTMLGGATIDTCRCLSQLVNQSEGLAEDHPEFDLRCIILANAVLDHKGWTQAKMPSMVQITLVDEPEQTSESTTVISLD
jgi:hypothetical protein